MDFSSSSSSPSSSSSSSSPPSSSSSSSPFFFFPLLLLVPLLTVSLRSEYACSARSFTWSIDFFAPATFSFIDGSR